MYDPAFGYVLKGCGDKLLECDDDVVTSQQSAMMWSSACQFLWKEWGEKSVDYDNVRFGLFGSY